MVAMSIAGANDWHGSLLVRTRAATAGTRLNARASRACPSCWPSGIRRIADDTTAASRVYMNASTASFTGTLAAAATDQPAIPKAFRTTRA